MDFLNDLNEAQREAVTYCEGSSLIVAGAGSGKTRVLTYKIAYLMSSASGQAISKTNGEMAARIPCEPYRILALTFTNKAAREMKERIGRLVGEDKARSLWMGTFHSVFSSILRQEAEVLGYTRYFSIYEPADCKSLLRAIVKDMNLDKETYPDDMMLRIISKQKNNMVTSEMYAGSHAAREHDKRQRRPEIANIYVEYERRMKKANAMDFDDLLLQTYLLFAHYPQIAKKYSERFDYILVDEYQDTNRIQVVIIRQLVGDKHTPVCAVGDDAQSIYAFRGAEIDNILSFQDTFAPLSQGDTGVRIYKLEQNYRSTQTIVQAASSMIAHNQNQIPKTLYSKLKKGDRIEVRKANTDKEEGEAVVKRIMQLVADEKGVDYGDMAILYRTNAQSRIFEEKLRMAGIPYVIYAGMSFYQRKEIKDILAYLRLIVNHSDEEALKRVINYPVRGIGASTLGKVVGTAHERDMAAFEVLRDASLLSVSNATRGKLMDFVSMMEAFTEDDKALNIYELTNRIIHHVKLKDALTSDDEMETRDRIDNVQELLAGMKEFCDSYLQENGSEPHAAEYLNEVSLLTTGDEDKYATDAPRVILSTVHGVKGLEFKYVFVVGMEEGLFPSERDADRSNKELEEERRLFYVALTRARHFCHLSYALTRFRYGRLTFGTPSRFITEIDRTTIVNY